MTRDDNDLLAYCEAWAARTEAEVTVTKVLCAVIVWGLLMMAGILMMHIQ